MVVLQWRQLFKFYFLIGGKRLCNVVLVSASQQHKSAITIHISAPSCSSLLRPSHPSKLSQSSRLGPCVMQQLLTSHLFYPWQCIYVSAALSIRPSPSLPAASTCLFSSSALPFLPCKEVHQYYFSRFHIYVLIHSICFSLSDLLHSV